MKRYIALWLLASPCLCFSQDGLTASLQRLAAIQDMKEQSSDAEYLRESSQALQLWNAVAPDDKASVAHKMALIHFRRAARLAASNDFEAAASELTAEATMQKEFEGRIEFATKSPDKFFRDLIELQAQLTAETGNDPLAGQVDYYFERDGDGFNAARLELGDDIAGITVPQVGAEESLALVHRLGRQGGKFAVSAPKWLVVPKGRLPDVLKQATREVVFDSSGEMAVHLLQAHPNPFQEPADQPAMKGAVENGRPHSASGEPTRSWQWSVIGMLIVAGFGLLWLLLKRRSLE